MADTVHADENTESQNQSSSRLSSMTTTKRTAIKIGGMH
jgi:hypothetical protein